MHPWYLLWPPRPLWRQCLARGAWQTTWCRRFTRVAPQQKKVARPRPDQCAGPLLSGEAPGGFYWEGIPGTYVCPNFIRPIAWLIIFMCNKYEDITVLFVFRDDSAQEKTRPSICIPLLLAFLHLAEIYCFKKWGGRILSFFPLIFYLSVLGEIFT